MNQQSSLRDNLGTIEKLRDALDAVLEQWCALADVPRDRDDDHNAVVDTLARDFIGLQVEVNEVLKDADDNLEFGDLKRIMFDVMTTLRSIKTLLERAEGWSNNESMSHKLLNCDDREARELAESTSDEDLASIILMWRTALEEYEEKADYGSMSRNVDMARRQRRIRHLDDVYNRRNGQSLLLSTPPRNNRNRRDDSNVEEGVANEEDRSDHEDYSGIEDVDSEETNTEELEADDQLINDEHHSELEELPPDPYNSESDDESEDELKDTERANAASSTIEDLSTGMNQVSLNRSRDQMPPTPDLTPDHSPTPAKPSTNNLTEQSNTTGLAFAPNPAAQGASQFLQPTQEDNHPSASSSRSDRARGTSGNAARGGARRGKGRRRRGAG